MMREQSVTAKVWYTDVVYTLVADVRQGKQVERHEALFGRYAEARAASVIARMRGEPVVVLRIVQHYDKARMSAKEFLDHAKVIESN